MESQEIRICLERAVKNPHAENERMRKALEQIEQQLDYGQINMALRIARRALEGCEWPASGNV